MESIDIAVIGAGPGGLTAGIYAARAGKKCFIFEKEFVGGQVQYSDEIQNYPSFVNINGLDLVDKMQFHTESLGSVIKNEFVENIIKVDDGFHIKTTENIFFAKKLILSMGASARKLGLKEELDFIGKGISYCATCDGAFFKKKVVVVVGGGDTAFEDILYLSSYCEKVISIHRNNEYKANQSLQKRVKSLVNAGKVELLTGVEVTKLIGNKFLEKVKLSNNKTINASGIFVAIGRVPDTNIVKSLVKLDDYGYIITDEDMKTNVDGIFAVGDIRKKTLRQIITACSDGAIAATIASLEI